ncbi:MAG: helix-hairpin-helix domain-containing protein, partial [bacterium]|nr:helix-hairpin-helix domain-containing protein [bacterium]
TLLSLGVIRDAADLYYMDEIKLFALPRIGKKLAANLLSAVQNSKSNSLEKLLTALGIPFIGEKAALTLARAYKDLDALMKANYSDLLLLPEIGEKMGESVTQYFSEPSNIGFIERLRKAGVNFAYVTKTVSGKLEGMTFVITGTLPGLSRGEAEEIIRQNGGSVLGSVSSKTTYLLAGEKAGGKLEKANSLGVKVIDMAELKILIG